MKLKKNQIVSSGGKATLMRNMRWECGYLKRKARSFGFTPLQNKDLLWQ